MVLRAADRYAYTGCGSTAYCYLFYWGRANTYTQKKTLSVENLSRANSWSLSSCACPSGQRAWALMGQPKKPAQQWAYPGPWISLQPNAAIVEGSSGSRILVDCI